jgi:hypothetical protein
LRIHTNGFPLFTASVGNQVVSINTIVIGPGLGRNEAMLEELCVLLDKAYKSSY